LDCVGWRDGGGREDGQKHATHCYSGGGTTGSLSIFSVKINSQELLLVIFTATFKQACFCLSENEMLFDIRCFQRYKI
jgi:hypothetical protein